MTLIIISFLSGVLTVLAPCVLPILPIILGASVEDGKNKNAAYIVIASLSLSILLFSILLKTTTLLIGVSGEFWKHFSGGLIIALGIVTLFPNIWKNLSTKLGFSDNSNKLLNSSSTKTGNIKYVLMGFALGPVFSSCSPTYALILAIIIPASAAAGFMALLSYVLGLASILLAISLFGQKLVQKLKWASDPSGIFKKILGVLFILIGLAIWTGYDKKIESRVLDSGFLNTTNFEQSVIDNLELENIEEPSDVQKEEGAMCQDGTCEAEKKEGTLSFLQPKNILKPTTKSITGNTGYQAPELKGLENWIHSESIESLDDLQGQVVAVKFWTYSCINCINTLDETQALYEKYKDQGFTIIGIHAPEFAYEKKLENVENAVTQYGLTFPVVQDNDFQTWKAYNNRYWPAFYLIDKFGKVRYTHFGEGKYDEKDQAVAELLSESGPNDTVGVEQAFLGDGLVTDTSKISIPFEEILGGGPPKDGIPAINEPVFLSQSDAESQMPYLLEDSQGIVLDIGGEQRYYSYDVLVWHEIVNDEIEEEKVSVTFCPLCGSAIVYDRNVNNREVNFGVSGKLYNSNLLMYDTHDETLWSQSLGKAVVGDQLGTQLDIVKSHLMTYQEFRENFPDGVVLSDNTGYSRNYGEVPYGNYDESEQLYFPVSGFEDKNFHAKALFYIVNHSDISLAFHWNDLRAVGEAEIQVGNDTYKATFVDGLADVTLNGEILPGYFEMWFSWRNHNQNNSHVWSKE